MIAAAQKALVDYVVDAWGSTTPLQTPNIAYEPQQGTTWARVAVVEAPSRRSLLTGERTTGHEHFGEVYLQLFFPSGRGEYYASDLPGAAAAILNEARIDVAGNTAPIVTETASVRTIGDDGYGWYQVNVSAPFSLLIH